MFFPGVAAILAPLGYGLWRANYAYARYGPVAAEYWSRPWYYLALAAAAIFLLLGLTRLRLSLTEVKVYPGGLSIRTGFGRPGSYDWSDISGLTSSIVEESFFGLPVQNKYKTRLILHSGKSIPLPSKLNDLAELTSRLKASMYPRLLPKLQAEFHNGSWLFFGPLAIQAAGLRLDNREISWQQVKYINVQAGRLVIEFNDRPTQKLPVERIPNLELVLQLIDQRIS